MKKLTRGENLCYGFLLAGCFLVMGAVDQSPVEDAQAEEARKEWIAEINARKLLEKDESVQPTMISSPQFVGRPNYDRQFALLREEHAKRVAEKN